VVKENQGFFKIFDLHEWRDLNKVGHRCPRKQKLAQSRIR
jgi:hypothetical protein